MDTLLIGAAIIIALYIALRLVLRLLPAGYLTLSREANPAFDLTLTGSSNDQEWRMDIVRLATFVDPPTTSQDEALNEVWVVPGSDISRRLDHTSGDAGKRESVDLPDL